MKEIIGKTKTKTRNLPRSIDKKTIPKQFNDYFINIRPNLLASNVQSSKGISYKIFSKYEGPVLEIKEIADCELHKAFSFLKSTKSPGYHNISSNIVKTVSNEVFSTIKHLFNIC